MPSPGSSMWARARVSLWLTKRDWWEKHLWVQRFPNFLEGQEYVPHCTSLARAGAAQHLHMPQSRSVGLQLPGEDGAEGEPGSVSRDSRSPSGSATAQKWPFSCKSMGYPHSSQPACSEKTPCMYPNPLKHRIPTLPIYLRTILQVSTANEKIPVSTLALFSYCTEADRLLASARLLARRRWACLCRRWSIWPLNPQQYTP